MHRIYFTSKKKKNVKIKFMNFRQKYTGSVFFLWGGSHPVFLRIKLGNFFLYFEAIYKIINFVTLNWHSFGLTVDK